MKPISAPRPLRSRRHDPIAPPRSRRPSSARSLRRAPSATRVDTATVNKQVDLQSENIEKGFLRDAGVLDAAGASAFKQHRARFFDAVLIPDADMSAMVNATELYRVYLVWCQHNGITNPMPIWEFGKGAPEP